MLCFIFIFSSCDFDKGYERVDFSKTTSLIKSQPKLAGDKILRIAVSAMVSPKNTIKFYQQILLYIGKQSGYAVQLVQRKTYNEVNEMFSQKQLDFAFICSGPYAIKRDKYSFEAIATPVVRGEPFYQAYLIVNKNSKISLLEELKGRSFMFTDPASNTGALVPTFWLNEMNVNAGSFFNKLDYSYSHDNSIMAVAKSLVDGASVDGHKWEYFQKSNNEFTSQTRVIKKSIKFGSPPFVASKDVPSKLKKQIQDILISMHLDPENEKILDVLMIDRFAIPDDSWYQPIKKIYQVTQSFKSKNDN